MRRLALLTVAGLLAFPASGAAQTITNTPPGNSGLRQYVEVVPTGGGDTPSKAVQKGKANLPPALRGAGRDGQRLADIAVQSSPAPARQALGQGRRSGKRAAGEGTDAKRRRSPARNPDRSTESDATRKALGTALTGSDPGGAGGLGVPLLIPMLVAATIVGLLTWGARRRTPEG